MIVFAAFTPHTPLLIDSIGKENIKHLSETREALKKVSRSLSKAKPDVLFVISSHSLVHERAFSINLHDEYFVDFKEFGDHQTYPSFFPDLELVTAIQRGARNENIPFVLESFSSLDYGCGVPLTMLVGKTAPALVPISYSGHDRKQHIAFGRLLKDVAMSTHKRIAVIASGDLAHSLTSDAPAGFQMEGKAFDETIVRSVEQFSVSSLLSLEDEVIEKASECGLRPLLILFGMLERIAIKPKVHSYEAPFGVGYLVAEFRL